jgi:hypothetical protein
MGGGSWKPSTYVNYATNVGLIDKAGMATNMAAHEIFKSNHLNQALDPKGLKVRESRDSVEHPLSHAIILALDVTGSMGFISQAMAQKGLPTLMKEIYERKPVADPQVLFMGIDDIECSGHIQVSQFESDIRIAEQLQQLWLEGGGGGNHYESYSMAWLLAAQHTSIDCWEKRKQKGYLFTIGDEEPTRELRRQDLTRVLGYAPQGKLDAESLLKEAQKHWNVYHIIVDEGSHARGYKNEVDFAWKELMGSNAIHLPNHTKLAEVIVSTIQAAEGVDHDTIAAGWDSVTASIVKAAIKDVKRVIEL